ncbi:hypothetical protein RMSM_01259 [Rhodopirellula maiorica SM1]|uniref:Uncharacterized protein n=1 Tax=Rhodopirellula maiorica SM1 TaxID=1265738 RepID=M5RRB5_9BACT|nr:hypothetical protein RMSM_01259 [Rhodopirellula maiorica SM1]
MIHGLNRFPPHSVVVLGALFPSARLQCNQFAVVSFGSALLRLLWADGAVKPTLT